MAGETLRTKDHEAIRRWAAERHAGPAIVPDAGQDEHPGALRLALPEQPGPALQQVSWEEFFAWFDERDLTFIYKETAKDGARSNFYRFDGPPGEDGFPRRLFPS